MIETYFPIYMMIALGAVLAIAFLFASEKLGPKKVTKEKESTYESGMEPVGVARERFSVKFYLVAMVFIIFDIEIVFMYPWAVQFRELGLNGLIAMLLFIATLFAGYIYVIKKEVLKWD